MSFTAGMELVVDPKTAMDLVWGATSHVWNFFSETGLQPAAAVWFTNCALYGGDSEGWTASLREAALIRPQAGFQLGKLKIGYPGKSVLPHLIATEYGTRWLGILAVAATLPDELVAGESLALFIKDTASHAARAFALDYKQCQTLWLLSREIFALSPSWYEFLRIAAECLKELEPLHPRQTPHRSIFPTGAYSNEVHMNQKLFFSEFMKPAFEIWQLSQRAESQGKTIRAKGYIGSAQLIFYLSVVCGLHVRFNSNNETTFGDPVVGQPDIVVDLGGDPDGPWEISYLFEGKSLGEAVTNTLQVLSIASPSQSQEHRPGIPRSKSTFQVYQQQPVSFQTGEVLLYKHGMALTIIKDFDITDQVSEWFLSLVYALEYYRVVHNVSNDPTRLVRLQPLAPTTAQAMFRAERTWQAIKVFAPYVLNSGHQKRLTQAFIKRERPRTRPVHLDISQFMPDWKCLEVSQRSQINQCCHYLQESAQVAWTASFVVNDPLGLRDLGALHEYGYCGGLTVQNLQTVRSDAREFCPIDRLVLAIAQRLAGGRLGTIEKCVGRVAGGFVTGLLGNEEQSVLQDQGVSIYFLPGTIASSVSDYEPERRLTKIVQDGAFKYMIRDPHYKVFVDTEYELCSAPRAYEKPRFIQNMTFTGATGHLSGKLEDIVPFDPISAVQWIPRVRRFTECLEPCIQGKLGQSQLARVVVTTQRPLAKEPELVDLADLIDPTDERENWKLHPELTHAGQPWELQGALVVIPAQNDPLIQRAVIADCMEIPSGFAKLNPAYTRLALTGGKCIPCAVQRALDEDMGILLIC